VFTLIGGGRGGLSATIWEGQRCGFPADQYSRLEKAQQQGVVPCQCFERSVFFFAFLMISAASYDLRRRTRPVPVGRRREPHCSRGDPAPSQLYVSSSGSDSNPGTAPGPLFTRSLGTARNDNQRRRELSRRFPNDGQRHCRRSRPLPLDHQIRRQDRSACEPHLRDGVG
jgi:hypothetical protein